MADRQRRGSPRIKEVYERMAQLQQQLEHSKVFFENHYPTRRATMASEQSSAGGSQWHQ